MPKRRHTDIWITSVRRWLGGMEGPSGEQLALPGMPEPPKRTAIKAVPFVLVTFASHDGTGVRPSRSYMARIIGTDPRQIQRATVEFERLGLLRRVNRAHRGEAQEWVLTIPEWLSGSHKKGDTGTSLSGANGRHRPPRKGDTGTSPPSSSKKMTSSAADGGAYTPPADTAPTVPAWSLPEDERKRVHERAQRGKAAALAAAGIGPRDDRIERERITDEKRAESLARLAEYQAAHPETVGAMQETGSHAPDG